ncbi:hypothetical protein HMPREF3187_01758 [Aerococcus christensenii]|uniref:Uncharacterized protein n=1 Tax=Aerococcus christensenii TaxID=87541 RepID=A0A133XQA4_9LACT|nr:hypothetical protein HMPREF3187_01758 [Aerococcus christensenii]
MGILNLTVKSSEKLQKKFIRKKQPIYCLNLFLRVYWDTIQKPDELDITKKKIL